jgi:Putative Actinobacterial Holin-X, holin superfamily III
MVDQTPMNDRSNGNGAGRSTFSSTRTAARNMAHLLHDAVTLAQLQIRLLMLDCQQFRVKLGIPLIEIAAGLILALACLPVALAGIALMFHDLAGWSWLTSVWATFGLTIVVGAAFVGYGIWALRKLPNVFESSRVEWTQNIERLKEILRRSSHPTQGEEEDSFAGGRRYR